MSNQQFVLKERPEGLPSRDTFELQDIPKPETGKGQLKLKARYISVDPYMRGRMRAGKSYVAPFQVGEPIEGGIVAEVLESRHPDFEKGQMVLGNLPWRKIQAVEADRVRPIDTDIAPAGYYLGILGMPGMTAYFGLLDIGKPKEGETVLVSGAAGAVGTVVGQIAKIKGCRVVGIAGSDEKNRYLKEELGFDEAINYKTTGDLSADLQRHCPDGIDVYFDNVGGEISDRALQLINKFARIVLCGQIALYNATEAPTGPYPQPTLLKRSALMQGFIVSNYQKRFGEAARQLAGWLKEGKLQYRETVKQGFEKLPDAFIGLFKGENIGKFLVEIS